MIKNLLLLPALFLSLLGFANNNLDSGLVAAYPFNGNANDSTLNGNNGIVMGATLTAGMDGVPNTAYHFNGTTDLIQIPDNPSLGLDSSITILAKFKSEKFTTAACQANHIVSKWDKPTNTGYTALFSDNPYDLSCSVRDTLHDVFYGATAGNNVQPGLMNYGVYIRNSQWYCVAFVQHNNVQKIYVNGTLYLTLSVQTNIGLNNIPLYIGGEAGTASFAGVIDDVRIYNRELKAEEINAYCGCSGNDLNSGLVASYSFTGDANDASGNNNNGTVYGGATLTTGMNGTPNTAYHFNGIDSYIEVLDNSTLDIDTAITLYAVFKSDKFYTGPCQSNQLISKWTESSGGLGYVAQFGDNPYDNDCNKMDTTKNIFTGATAGNNWYQNLYDYGKYISSNEWHCAAFTQSNKIQNIYLDGVLYKTIPVTQDIGVNNVPLWFGRNNLGVSAFTGTIDEVRIYNRALSKCEIEQLCGTLVQCSIPDIFINRSGDSLYTNASYSSYQWYLNGTLISGATNYYYIVSQTGFYSLEVTDSLGCKGRIDNYIFEVGIESLTNDRIISIYPNPSQGAFTVSFKMPSKNHLTIFNSIGEEVYATDISSSTQIISSHLPAGIYFVRVINSENLYTQKIIIQ